MNREFGYNWRRLWISFITVIAAIIFIVWKKGNLDEVSWSAIAGVILIVVTRQTLTLCKIQLKDSEIHLFFISPLRLNQKLQFSEINSYTEVLIQKKGKKSPIAGLLKPKDSKRITLLNIGTKNFAELSSTLSGLFAQEKK